MVKKKIVDWVEDMKSRKYNPQQIKDELIKGGYSEQDFLDAMYDVEDPTPKQEGMGAGVAAVIVLIIVILYFVFTAPPDLDISKLSIPEVPTKHYQPSALPGETVNVVEEVVLDPYDTGDAFVEDVESLEEDFNASESGVSAYDSSDAFISE